MGKRFELAYVDVDDCCVDFVGGIAAVYDITGDMLTYLRNRPQWDMIPTLTEILRLEKDMTQDELFAPVKDNFEFWRRLTPCPWLHDLVEFAQEIADDWRIVTAPQDCPSSHFGKVLWAKDTFGSDFKKLHVTDYKVDLARPGVCMIDDKPKTIEQFKDKGASGLLFPGLHNGLRRWADRPVTFLRSVIANLPAV